MILNGILRRMLVKTTLGHSWGENQLKKKKNTAKKATSKKQTLKEAPKPEKKPERSEGQIEIPVDFILGQMADDYTALISKLNKSPIQGPEAFEAIKSLRQSWLWFREGADQLKMRQNAPNTEST